jgi:hypothetical protein
MSLLQQKVVLGRKRRLGSHGKGIGTFNAAGPMTKSFSPLIGFAAILT